MPANLTTYRNRIIAAYCIIFYVLMVYKWFNGMFLYQIEPNIFYTRADVFTWVLMNTGIHNFFLGNKASLVLMDAGFYLAPILFYLVHKKFLKLEPWAAIAMLLMNWLYVQCYTLYPTNSIEGHIAWLLFPIIFIPRNEKTFALLFDGLRYFFLFFFASAGIWKIVQGGIFNTEQMSNILLYQHKELLHTTPQHWYASFVLWLVNHSWLSYSLYLIATVIELFFIVGFFTKKYDKLLIGLFLLFLVFDHFVMRIPYYEVLPFTLTLLLRRKDSEFAEK